MPIYLRSERGLRSRALSNRFVAGFRLRRWPGRSPRPPSDRDRRGRGTGRRSSAPACRIGRPSSFPVGPLLGRQHVEHFLAGVGLQLADFRLQFFLHFGGPLFQLFALLVGQVERFGQVAAR